jgi:hypothetical protein
MDQKRKAPRPKGSRQVRQEKRGGKLLWGYHVWLRQPDGSRKQVRDFSFSTKQEAKEALRAIQTAFRKERYGLVPSRIYTTTIETAINRYKMLAQAKRMLRRSGQTTLREQSGYFQPLDRFTQWPQRNERKDTFVKSITTRFIAGSPLK